LRHGWVILPLMAFLMGCQGQGAGIDPIYKSIKSEADSSEKPSEYCTYSKKMLGVSWIGHCAEHVVPIDHPVVYDVFGLKLPKGYSILFDLCLNGDDLGAQNMIMLLQDKKQLQLTLSDSHPKPEEYRQFTHRLDTPGYAHRLLTAIVFPFYNPDVDPVSVSILENTDPILVLKTQTSPSARPLISVLSLYEETGHRVETLQLTYNPMHPQGLTDQQIISMLKQEMRGLLPQPTYSVLAPKFYQGVKPS